MLYSGPTSVAEAAGDDVALGDFLGDHLAMSYSSCIETCRRSLPEPSGPQADFPRRPAVDQYTPRPAAPSGSFRLFASDQYTARPAAPRDPQSYQAANRGTYTLHPTTSSSSSNLTPQRPSTVTATLMPTAYREPQQVATPRVVATAMPMAPLTPGYVSRPSVSYSAIQSIAPMQQQLRSIKPGLKGLGQADPSGWQVSVGWKYAALGLAGLLGVQFWWWNKKAPEVLRLGASR